MDKDNLQSDPQNWTITVLRKELKKAGLSPTGLKSELVERYKNHIATPISRKENVLNSMSEVEEDIIPSHIFHKKKTPINHYAYIVKDSEFLKLPNFQINKDTVPSTNIIHTFDTPNVNENNNPPKEYFLDKTKVIGLSQRELKKRKYEKEEENIDRQKNVYFNVDQQNFFQQARTELEVMKQQKNHSKNMQLLIHRFEELEEELKEKEEVIQNLILLLEQRKQILKEIRSTTFPLHITNYLSIDTTLFQLATICTQTENNELQDNIIPKPNLITSTETNGHHPELKEMPTEVPPKEDDKKLTLLKQSDGSTQIYLSVKT